jgi:hypothetical protein
MGLDPLSFPFGKASVDVPGEQLPDPLVDPLAVSLLFSHGLVS